MEEGDEFLPPVVNISDTSFALKLTSYQQKAKSEL